MATEQYKILIDELCALTGLSLRPSLYERADLEVDKVFFSLAEVKAVKASRAGSDVKSGKPQVNIADHAAAQGIIAVFCDFGPSPRSNREMVLQRLLELNLSLQGDDLPVMSMNHENGHVVLCRRLPLIGLNALDLLNKMKDHAGQAKEWRHGGCFLEEPGKETARKSDGARRNLIRFQGAA